MALRDRKNLCLFFQLSSSANRSHLLETVHTLMESAFPVVCHFPHSVSFLHCAEQYERGLVMSLDWLMAARRFCTKNCLATTSHDQCILNWIVCVQGALIREHHILPVTNLECISVGLEHHEGLQLCQVVSQLLISRALNNSKLAMIIAIPEPVSLSQEVFGPVCDALVRHQVVGALIVFKHSSM